MPGSKAKHARNDESRSCGVLGKVEASKPRAKLIRNIIPITLALIKLCANPRMTPQTTLMKNSFVCDLPGFSTGSCSVQMGEAGEGGLLYE